MQTTAELTGRQREIWSFLLDYVDRHGYPPTVREIGGAVGLASPSTVHAHLANLERAGLLRRDPTKPRALERGPPQEGEQLVLERPVYRRHAHQSVLKTPTTLPRICTCSA